MRCQALWASAPTGAPGLCQPTHLLRKKNVGHVEPRATYHGPLPSNDTLKNKHRSQKLLGQNTSHSQASLSSAKTPRTPKHHFPLPKPPAGDFDEFENKDEFLDFLLDELVFLPTAPKHLRSPDLEGEQRMQHSSISHLPLPIYCTFRPPSFPALWGPGQCLLQMAPSPDPQTSPSSSPPRVANPPNYFELNTNLITLQIFLL